MGVLLQGFYQRHENPQGVPSPLDGDTSVPWWWDHLAAQASDFRRTGFTAIWLPPPWKGASGGFSNGYDVFDDYDLGSKNQKGLIPTRYGSREQLQRCAAIMRANGLDIYIDMVENQRDGESRHEPFHFKYVDAYGTPGRGRFPKGPKDFHPNVPEDPGVFDDSFSFGRDLAPINGQGHYVFKNLLGAGEWLTKALDAQGYRIDDAKGVSTIFLSSFLNHGAMQGKFAVGEFFDGDIGKVQSWINATNGRCSAFDFPLRFMLQRMCNTPAQFSMASLDHAGLAGVDPMRSVTFVEDHDTDLNVGEAIFVRKALAYAYILTSEGYPCVFYKDYSTDKGCYGLRNVIDKLIWIHENLAVGPTLQRWKDDGVFVYQRLGGRKLLTGLNKDESASRTVTVATAFGPHVHLREYTGHGHDVITDSSGNATITIPKNIDGSGYVCYAEPVLHKAFDIRGVETTQEYAGAEDLDIKPADNTEMVTTCRVWVGEGTVIRGALFFDASHWTDQTIIQLQLLDTQGQVLASGEYSFATQQGKIIESQAHKTGFYTFKIRSLHTPPSNLKPAYWLRVSYKA